LVIGILALQGAVEPHKKHLQRLGAAIREIRLASDLPGISGLILPGGESTTMLKLAQEFSLWEPLKEAAQKIPFFGVCAGSILMAKEVTNPSQPSLGVMDISVKRNGYGRQLDSFHQNLKLIGLPQTSTTAVFIRAPKFISWNKQIMVRAEWNGEAVFLDDGKHLACAFHPELLDDSWAHRFFLERCSGAAAKVQLEKTL
jgi:5'-phosphate synthase pdxT subunit